VSIPDRSTSRRRTRFVGAFLALAILLGACAPTQSTRSDEAGDPSSSLLPGRLELPELGFPEFQALLQELRGQPVVVNIWGSWCPPCQLEAPDLARVSHDFAGRVQFLGVDILDSRPAAREFILRFGWPYPSVFDPAGEIRGRLGYIGQPVTVIYDRHGEVAFEWPGVVTTDLLTREIREVLRS
jgi:thiol-disulfide isomerase/thioredoxin